MMDDCRNRVERIETGEELIAVRRQAVAKRRSASRSNANDNALGFSGVRGDRGAKPCVEPFDAVRGRARTAGAHRCTGGDNERDDGRDSD